MELSRNDISFIENHIDEISDSLVIFEGISSADIILKIYQYKDKLELEKGFKYEVVITKVEDAKDRNKKPKEKSNI